jgi:hypothetical protein
VSTRARVEEVLRFLDIEDPEGVLRALRREGLFESDVLEDRDADELRVAASLMRELGVNAAGVEVILHMRRRMLVLEERVRVSLRELLDDREDR